MTKTSRKPPLWLAATVIVLTLPMLLPIMYILQYGFASDLSNAMKILFDETTWELLKTTFKFTFLVTAMSLVIGLVCAYYTECTDLPFRNLLATFISLPLCIPALVSSFTWFSIDPIEVNRFLCEHLDICSKPYGRIRGFWGTTFVMTLVSLPLCYIPLSAALGKLDTAWIKVSQSLGKGNYDTFMNAVLPQLKPAIGNGILLVSFHMLIEFGATSIMGLNTFAVAIYNEIDAFYNTQGAALYALILVLLCFTIVALELKFRGSASIAKIGKGVVNPIRRKKLGPIEKSLAVGLFLLIFSLGIVIPVIILVTWLVSGTGIHSEYFQISEFARVIFNTVWMSLGASLFTLVAAVPIVWLAVYYKSPMSTFADRIPFILHAIPALLIALSIAKYTVHYANPLYQTYWVLIPAYFMLYIPLAQTSIRTSIEQVPRGVINISNSLGRSGGDLVKRIILPIIKPGLIAGFALTFLQMMKELTATLILAPLGTSTISIEIWNATNDYSFSIAAAYSMALIVFSGLPVYILKRSFNLNYRKTSNIA